MSIPRYYPNVKRVNIIAHTQINIVNPPILGAIDNIEMTAGNILRCLCRRAEIYEVLSDGTKVRLTTKNFRDDFEAPIKAKRLAAKKAAEAEETAPDLPAIEKTKTLNVEDKIEASSEANVEENAEEEDTSDEAPDIPEKHSIDAPYKKKKKK